MAEQPTDNRPTKVRFFPEAPFAGGQWGRGFGSVAKTGQHPPLKREMREFDSPRTHQISSRPKLIRRSSRLLTGRELVRFQSGAPQSCREDVGKRRSRQAFNLEIAGSNPAVLTRVPFVQRIRTRVYGTRNSGSNPERDASFDDSRTRRGVGVPGSPSRNRSSVQVRSGPPDLCTECRSGRGGGLQPRSYPVRVRIGASSSKRWSGVIGNHAGLRNQCLRA